MHLIKGGLTDFRPFSCWSVIKAERGGVEPSFRFGLLGLTHLDHLPSPWMSVERLQADPVSSTGTALRQTPSDATRFIYITHLCIITVAAQYGAPRYIARVWWEPLH